VIDKPTAWACAAANAAALPGLGTLAAGRRIGYAQAALALAGFALSLFGLAGILRDWSNQGGPPERITPSLWLGLAGIGLYAIAWLWALSSSLRLHRQAPPCGSPAPAPPAASPPRLPPGSSAQ
jgi:hypothetical protein